MEEQTTVERGSWPEEPGPADKPQRIEQQLYQSEQWLRMLIDSAEDYAIFAVNPEGRICTWNKGAQKLFGFSEDEILGQEFSIIFTPEDRAGGVPGQEIEHALRQGYSPDERWHQRKDGTRLFVSGSVRPLRDRAGQVHGFLKVAHDITHIKKTELSLRQTEERLGHANEELEERVRERTARLLETVHELEGFSYSLSHDMRAPLRAMRGFAHILRNDFGERLGPEGTEMLTRIINAASRLDQLIQDVLALSRISTDRLRAEPVDVEKLLYQIIQERSALQAPRSDIQILGPLQKVLGHQASLTQCLSNLLVNAAKFVAPGTHPRVRIWTEQNDSRVRIWVEDNGIGIPPEYHERIFGMFQRLHGEEHYRGTGIGLAIVRKAVERMHGQVGVESEVGKGSRFWLDLPAADRRAAAEAGD